MIIKKPDGPDPARQDNWQRGWLMINAILFDLDGTLVQTERLKALSYTKAIEELDPSKANEDLIMEAYKQVVGLSRRDVALTLIRQFNLEAAASARMVDFGVSVPWQAFVQVRLKYYDAMLADRQLLQRHQISHTVDLLKEARQTPCKLGLATMSYCDQTRSILKALDLDDVFHFVATIEDVENGKPDPEIYLLVASELEIPEYECLVIEDSAVGVKAAVDAGMWCIAMTTSFTTQVIHQQELLPPEWIVDNPTHLRAVVGRLVPYLEPKSLL
jgi:beta-phosphoglucomutase